MSLPSFFDPKTWQVVEDEGFRNFYSNVYPKKSGEISLMAVRKKISPFDVYRYLKSRFGPPNGIQTKLKRPRDSNNLVHWDYLVSSQGYFVYICGVGRSVHIYVYGHSLSDQEWIDFLSCIRKDFKFHSDGMGKVSQDLQKWNMVSNRFSRIADACAGFHEKLFDAGEIPSFDPIPLNTPGDLEKYKEKLNLLGERATNIFDLSFALDLMTPILGEAFVNMVIFLCRKREIKLGNDAYKAYIRRPINERVLHIKEMCDHFKQAPDRNREEYKAFLRVMNRRNFSLHGNIDPTIDSFETVYFDDFTPLFTTGDDPILRYMENKEKVADTAGVLQRYEDVHSFIHYILSILDDKPRDSVKMILDATEYGYEKKRDKTGILFPDTESQMLMPIRHDDELDGEQR